MTEWRRALERAWYRGHPGLTPLRPLGALVRRVARRRLRRFQAEHRVPPVPVLVVGNITVGGTGKTPLVIALVERARQRGLKVAVISRGYGSRLDDYPYVVSSEDSAGRIGDEPLLIARRTGVPVVLDPRRDRALARAMAYASPDLVISDDGLQHYALPRSAELVVLDNRGLGNRRCLPAGPLREGPERLEQVDFLVANGGGLPGAIVMRLEPDALVRLADGERLPLDRLRERFGAVHGVAGIGNPERFFRTLTDLGLAVTPHAFPDHHRFRPGDLDFQDRQPVIMTEKDAVKCQGFNHPGLWMLPVSARLSEQDLDAIIDRALNGRGVEGKENG